MKEQNSQFAVTETLFLLTSVSHRLTQVVTATRSSSPHSAPCAHGWPRRLPVWRRKWPGCFLSWLAIPRAICRVRAQSGACPTGCPRCLCPRRDGPGRAKSLWGKRGNSSHCCRKVETCTRTQQPSGPVTTSLPHTQAFSFKPASQKNVFLFRLVLKLF